MAQAKETAEAEATLTVLCHAYAVPASQAKVHSRNTNAKAKLSLRAPDALKISARHVAACCNFTGTPATLAPGPGIVRVQNREQRARPPPRHC